MVYTLCQSRDDAQVEFLAPRGAGVSLGKKATVILLLWDPSQAETLPAELKHLMKQKAQGTLVVGLLGGSQNARRILKKARPMMTAVKVGQIHLNDQGDLWSRDAHPVHKALEQLATTPQPSEAAWAGLLAQAAASFRCERRRDDRGPGFSSPRSTPAARWRPMPF